MSSPYWSYNDSKPLTWPRWLSYAPFLVHGAPAGQQPFCFWNSHDSFCSGLCTCTSAASTLVSGGSISSSRLRYKHPLLRGPLYGPAGPPCFPSHLISAPPGDSSAQVRAGPAFCPRSQRPVSAYFQLEKMHFKNPFACLHTGMFY